MVAQVTVPFPFFSFPRPRESELREPETLPAFLPPPRGSRENLTDRVGAAGPHRAPQSLTGPGCAVACLVWSACPVGRQQPVSGRSHTNRLSPATQWAPAAAFVLPLASPCPQHLGSPSAGVGASAPAVPPAALLGEADSLSVCSYRCQVRRRKEKRPVFNNKLGFL